MLDYDWYMSSSFPTLIRLRMITHNVVPPSYKLVYKPHEYYSYVRTINHKLLELFAPTELSFGGTTLQCSFDKPVERGWHRGFMWLQSHQKW